jgi:type 1 glutamine amidotransferase
VAELADYVHAGGGFLAVHSGNTAREGEPYADFVGNYFVGHPPRCEVTASVVPGHPITAGVQDFLIRDEHYEIGLTCQDAEVFLKTRSATGGEQVGGYTRTLGKGRLCSLTPGHILDVWHNSSYQRLLGNALLYCTGQL